MDFILLNRYVWGRSLQLVQSGVSSKDIGGTNAWKWYYNVPSGKGNYFFSYDAPAKRPDFTGTFEMIDSYKPSFLFDAFRDGKVYLYRRILR
jgi:hypothetical protein